MPLPLLAIPVIHSSGAWIAYGTGGYLAGTLSSTWAGAFIVGNATALGAAGVTAAAGTWAAVTGMTSSAAVALGLAPATFLGLTPMGWAIAGAAGTTALAVGGAVYYKSAEIRAAIDGQLDQINEERAKGGLEPFESSWELIKSLISTTDKEEK